MTDKHALRATMRQRLAAMAAGDLTGKSAVACSRLIELPEFTDARVVMAYLHMPAELAVTAAIEAAWAEGKTVLVPRVDLPTRHMDAIAITSFDAMVPGAYDILEPLGEPFNVSRIDLIIVPGLAFDRSGNRLGQGAGFYDRFLSRRGMRAALVAVGFDEQVVARVPTAASDWPMDAIVTDKDIIRPPAADKN